MRMVIVTALLHDDCNISRRTSSVPIRMLIAGSQPVLWVTLGMAFVWLTLRPSRRWIVRSFRQRNVDRRSMGVALWRAAGDVLAQGPYLILAMLLIGGVIGVLLAGLSGAPWGFAAAVFGASLAPAIFEPAEVTDERA